MEKGNGRKTSIILIIVLISPSFISSQSSYECEAGLYCFDKKLKIQAGDVLEWTAENYWIDVIRSGTYEFHFEITNIRVEILYPINGLSDAIFKKDNYYFSVDLTHKNASTQNPMIEKIRFTEITDLPISPTLEYVGDKKVNRFQNDYEELHLGSKIEGNITYTTVRSIEDRTYTEKITTSEIGEETDPVKYEDVTRKFDIENGILLSVDRKMWVGDYQNFTQAKLNFKQDENSAKFFEPIPDEGSSFPLELLILIPILFTFVLIYFAYFMRSKPFGENFKGRWL